MANGQGVGGCLWKLFQVGLVAILIAMGFLFVVSGDREKEKLGEHETDPAKREEEGAASGGLIARLRELLGMERDSHPGGVGSSNSAAGGRAMQRAQEKDAKGNIDLEKLLGVGDEVRRDRDRLAEGTTEVDQLVLWGIVDGEIYYRIILTPYDREAHKLMMDKQEALFISFGTPGGERIVPKAAAFRIPTRELRVATKEGYAAGWFVDGKLPLDGQEEGKIEKPVVGWIFSGGLHARLRKLQGAKPVDGSAPVKDPYGIRTRTE